jgi:hypothetical protein
MTSDPQAVPNLHISKPADPPRGHWFLLRWFASYATLSVPQAAAPVAFSLIALRQTGATSGGAAMILAMTLAQIAGAVPITRLRGGLPASAFLRLLILLRTLALMLVAACAYYQIPFELLVVLAALSGSVSGAAAGYLRSLLNQLTQTASMPRSLGIAATLNEVTFVLAPVLASGVGSISPVLAVVSLAVLGALPALLIPKSARSDAAPIPQAKVSVLTAPILLWLACATAQGSAVAAIEIGAVSLALKFGYAPTLAILFTVPLCVASVTGGTWVSLRNRVSSRRTVLAQLSVMTLGAALAAFGPAVVIMMAGAIVIGSVLAPLSAHYSLVLDGFAPPHKRPEVFALLRTATALGVVLASATITLFNISIALLFVTALMSAVTMAIAFTKHGWQGADQPL